MPTLAAFLLADAIEKDEAPKPKPKPKPGEEEEQRGSQAPAPDPDLSSPEQVAHDRHSDKARDLKRRAREESYNALELENSKASHAKAAEAHRAAAKASGKALGSATDPRAKGEFRSSEHSHNLHAAYHEKMSHATEEERKASAEKGKVENGKEAVGKRQPKCMKCKQDKNKCKCGKVGKGGPGSGPHPGAGKKGFARAEAASSVANAASQKAKQTGNRDDHASALSAHRAAFSAHVDARDHGPSKNLDYHHGQVIRHEMAVKYHSGLA